MDIAGLGGIAADLMGRIENDYGEDAEIRTVVIHVEVDREDKTTIVTHSNEDRGWVLQAFMDQAADRVDEVLHPQRKDDS